ncbi:outer membrane protein [Spirosoma soli]|uniref:Outer membrane protein n=1 Tax=Spirosoma soli TaxID=1770529 RepID=A0ABW5M1J2_9BACT
MKRQISLLFALLPLVSLAQTQPKSKQNDLLGQGKFSIGLGLGGGTGGSTGTYGRVAPRAQYFVKNGWSVNVEGRHETNGKQYSYSGAGLTTRYYVLRTNKVTIFGQAGYFYGRSRNRTYTFELTAAGGTLRVEETNQFGMANAGIGAQYKVGKRWSLEALHEYNYGRCMSDNSMQQTRTTIGMNFLLKKP